MNDDLDDVTREQAALRRVTAIAAAAGPPEAVFAAVTAEGSALLGGVPMSLARLHQRKDAGYRPLLDAPTSSVGLAWLRDRTTEDVETFIGIVRGRTVNSSRSPRPSEPVAPTQERKKQPPRPARDTATRGGQNHRGSAKRPGRSRGR